MIILGIDTSCDDTCVSIVEAKNSKTQSPDFKILSNIVSSQVKIHRKYKGVYPTMAKREHQKNLIPVLERAIKKAKISKETQKANKVQETRLKILKKILNRNKDLLERLIKFLNKYKKPKIDLIAVTIGPGLEPCLWEGVNLAKSLSYFWKKPIVPVNHIKAHILANWLSPISESSELFPALCLVISGGHTELILMRDYKRYKLIGETRDDAAGECLDKTARILGLPYPGGPEIEREAKKYCPRDNSYKIQLPRPMLYTKDYDFSFSGLKTAVLYDFKKRPLRLRKSKKYVRAMSAEIEKAVIDVVVFKTLKAVKEFKAKAVLLGGGVAANERLRREFNSQLKKFKPQLKFLVPPKAFCTDNAAMVATAGYFQYLQGNQKNWKEIKAESTLKIKDC